MSNRRLKGGGSYVWGASAAPEPDPAKYLAPGRDPTALAQDEHTDGDEPPAAVEGSPGCPVQLLHNRDQAGE